MNVVENFVRGKREDQSLCEDLIAILPGFVVVIDGATDKWDRYLHDRTGGVLAAECIRDAFESAPEESDLRAVVDAASELVRDRIASSAVELDPLVDDGPSAVFVAYSVARGEIWRVGDCSWMTDSDRSEGIKKVDDICSNARATLLKSLILQGTNQDELRRSDPGREMILPILRNQHVFRNLKDSDNDLGFGAIDGRQVPDHFLETWKLAEGSELILQTDGYPHLARTLEIAESELAWELENDPLRIGSYPSTKGMAPNDSSFDDRAFVRLIS